MSQPPPPQAGATPASRGLASGITSLASAVMAPVLAVLSLPFLFLVAAEPLAPVLVSEPGRYRVALAVLLSFAAALAVTSAVTGILALRLSANPSAGRVTGIIGLGFTAFSALAALWMGAAISGF